MSIFQQHNEHTNNANTVNYDSVNNIIWSGDSDGKVIGWDIDTQSIAYQHSEHTGNVRDVEYDSVNNIIWSSGNKVIGWDIDTQSIAYEHSQHSASFGPYIQELDYDSNNNIIWSCSNESQVIGWDIDTQSIAYQHSEHRTDINVYDLEYDSVNNNIITSGGFDSPGELISWDVDTQTVNYKWQYSNDGIQYSELDLNNNVIWIKTFDDRLIKLDRNTQNILDDLPYNNVSNLKYDSENNILWIGTYNDSGNEPKLDGWDIENSTVKYSNETPSNLNEINYDSNNNIIWVGLDNNDVIGYDFGIGVTYDLYVKIYDEDDNDGLTGEVIIDGTTYNYTDGLEKFTLDKGSHTVETNITDYIDETQSIDLQSDSELQFYLTKDFLEKSNQFKLTKNGAEILIDTLLGQNTEQISEHKLGEGTVNNRTDTSSIDVDSSLNTNWNSHTVEITNGQLQITSILEVPESDVDQIDNLSELGVLTANGTLLQYLPINIDSSEIDTSD